MRRALTVSALALLAVPAVSAAPVAAGPAKERVHHTITLQEGRSPAGRRQAFEIVDWGFDAAAGIGGFSGRQTGGLAATQTPSTSATGENVQGSQDIVITGSRIPQPNLTSASPVTMPPGDRVLRVKVRFPWLACEEGKVYPQLVLGDPVALYTLSDVTVTRCFRNGATFSYAKAELGLR